jgi:hypothetical protein
LMESSVTHVPRNFLDFHIVKVFFFFNFSEIMLFSLYYLIYLMSFIECNCDGYGSLDGKCDDAGKCSCNTCFDGVKCNTCAKNFFGFPQCQGIFFFNFSKIIVIYSLLSIICLL